jgi:hypothetical protein
MTKTNMTSCNVYKEPTCLCNSTKNLCCEYFSCKTYLVHVPPIVVKIQRFLAHHVVHLHLDEPCFVWTIHYPNPNPKPKILTAKLGIQLAIAVCGFFSFVASIYGGVKKFQQWIVKRRGEANLNAWERIVQRWRTWRVKKRTKASSKSLPNYFILRELK